MSPLLQVAFLNPKLVVYKKHFLQIVIWWFLRFILFLSTVEQIEIKRKWPASYSFLYSLMNLDPTSRGGAKLKLWGSSSKVFFSRILNRFCIFFFTSPFQKTLSYFTYQTRTDPPANTITSQRQSCKTTTTIEKPNAQCQTCQNPSKVSKIVIFVCVLKKYCVCW